MKSNKPLVMGLLLAIITPLGCFTDHSVQQTMARPRDGATHTITGWAVRNSLRPRRRLPSTPRILGS